MSFLINTRPATVALLRMHSSRTLKLLESPAANRLALGPQSDDRFAAEHSRRLGISRHLSTPND
jgi:hypothetical protein